MDYIEAITEIANHDVVVQTIESNVVWHEDIKPNQTKRILYAIRLFEDELQKNP